MVRLSLSVRALPWLLAVAPAQNDPKVAAAPPARLGVLSWHDSPNDQAAFAGIKDGMKLCRLPCEFVERRADADVQRGAAALAELRELRCALVFALGTQAALMATRTLTEVPVVYVAVADPVASGIVAGWQGSGRNVAGASYRMPPARVLDVFRLAIPGLQRLGILRSIESGLVSQGELAAMNAHLAEPGAPQVALVEAVARDADDLPRAVDALAAARAQAIWIPNDFTVYRNLDRVRAQLQRLQLPLVTTAIGAARSDAIAGATVDFALHGHRAAALALRILRGEAPGSLPVDTMQSLLVTANLDAARRSGCELPLALLAVADELIPRGAQPENRPGANDHGEPR
jgi:putative ABC transport system substrate-binding protein